MMMDVKEFCAHLLLRGYRRNGFDTRIFLPRTWQPPADIPAIILLPKQQAQVIGGSGEEMHGFYHEVIAYIDARKLREPEA